MRQPDELIELFEATREELRELLFGAQPHIAEWGVWHTEAYVRFGQSLFALQRFRALEVELEPRIRDRKFSDEGTALRFFAESFYYFAWRCRKVMCMRVEVRDANRRVVKPFKTLDPVGIRRVRNELIEHSDKNDGVSVTHFRFACPEGLILQWGHGEPIDVGLYPNAEDMVMQVRDRVRRVTGSGTARFR